MSTGGHERAVPSKDGIYERDGILYVIGSKYIARVASTLASDTRAKLLELIIRGVSDLDELAKLLGQSKANISNQVRRLEELDIVRSRYAPGSRGIKKLVRPRIRKIVFIVGHEEHRA